MHSPLTSIQQDRLERTIGVDATKLLATQDDCAWDMEFGFGGFEVFGVYGFQGSGVWVGDAHDDPLHSIL